MPIRRAGFKRKSRLAQEIPTCSMADIAFLLLIFFMVTTTFRTDRTRPIVWPAAAGSERIDEKAKNILNIWVERSGAIYINDRPVALPDVSTVVGPLHQASEERLVISIRGDRDVPYHAMDALQEELIEAGVRRVVFATELEERVQRTSGR